jgi:hypothetical protein
MISDNEYIDKYIFDELSESEEEEFELRLLKDEEFRKLFDRRMTAHEVLEEVVNAKHNVIQLHLYRNTKFIKTYDVTDSVTIEVDKTATYELKDDNGDVVFEELISADRKDPTLPESELLDKAASAKHINAKGKEIQILIKYV